MLYQLPNGKVIHLTIEEFLDLSDADIQYLVSINYGETIIDPFHKSAMHDKEPRKKAKEEIQDFNPESEDIMDRPGRTLDSYLNSPEEPYEDSEEDSE